MDAKRTKQKSGEPPREDDVLRTLLATPHKQHQPLNTQARRTKKSSGTSAKGKKP